MHLIYLRSRQILASDTSLFSSSSYKSAAVHHIQQALCRVFVASMNLARRHGNSIWAIIRPISRFIIPFSAVMDKPSSLAQRCLSVLLTDSGELELLYNANARRISCLWSLQLALFHCRENVNFAMSPCFSFNLSYTHAPRYCMNIVIPIAALYTFSS